jgi:protein ImuB
VRTVGELARLPADEVASRLGEAGQELHATARGLDPRPLSPRQPPPVFEEGLELEWPLVALEPFLFAARSALERLAGRLETCGLACARLELSLLLEPEGRAERGLELPAPTRDWKTLLTLVRLDLEARPPGAPVVGFRFTAHPDRPRQAQLALFGPPELSPDRLATTLARLFALLGPGRVGSPRPEDGHRPERVALVEYRPPPPPRVRPAPAGSVRGLLAVRVLRPPVELEVLTANGGDSAAATPPRPATLRSPRGEGIGGTVRVASGPWAMEDGWWTESPAEREYWDVELADGALYRIYRDRTSGDWFADGIYD